MKHSELSGKFRLTSRWGGVAAATLLAIALAGCGGGSDGAAGAAGTPGAPGAPGAAGPAGPAGKDASAVLAIPSNTVAATPDAAAAWAALAPQVTVTSVTINSPPVVKFTVKDATGKPIVGLGNTSKSSAQTVPVLTNFFFTLAKLVPAQSGTFSGKTISTEPSKWVTYLVTKPPSVAQKAGTLSATDSCDSATAPTVCGTYPTFDREGTLVDNGDGSYQYTFYRDIKQAAAQVASLTDSANGLSKKADLGDVSYDATLTHRLGIQISGAAPGTGANNPSGSGTGAPAGVNMVNTANAWYDFVPAGGTPTATREVVKIDSCSECHAGKGLAHGAARKDPNYCVTCHTDQIKYSFNAGEATSTNGGMTLTGTTRPTTAILGGRAIGNYPNMVHKIHMGEGLIRTGYFFNADGAGKFNDVLYPQPVTNCVKCHDGSATAKNKTANGDNWKNVPSMVACGACHDGIDFATGTGVTRGDMANDLAAGLPVGTTRSGHVGGAQADNSACNLCHSSANIPVYHATVDMTGANGRGGYPLNTAQDVPTPGYPAGQGPSIPLASQLNLPAGALKIDYQIKSASIATVAGVTKGSIVFRIMKDDPANRAAAMTPVTLNATGYLIDNLDGAPGLYFAYSLPQDGIAAPADWTSSIHASVKDVRDSLAKGTLSGPDASGYYTATLAQPIPAGARMVTAGLGLDYAGFVQLNLPTYPKGIRLREPVFQIKAATGNTDDGKANVARRSIVSADKCNSCHGQLGVSPSFHSGARNNGEGCAFCHTPSTPGGHGASGWSVQVKNLVHSIHASSKRAQAFTYQATTANPTGFQGVTYPGVLNKCEQCHVQAATTSAPRPTPQPCRTCCGRLIPSAI